jgi:hypothetical protein
MEPAERYRNLIDATIREALSRRRKADHPIALTEVGLLGIASGQRMSLDPEFEASLRTMHAGLSPTSIIRDGAGHGRPMYRGLVWRTLGTRLTLSEVDRRTFDAFANRNEPVEAMDAQAAVGAAFDAIAIGDVRPLERIVFHQQTDGTFIRRTASDNPEPLWYCELALLHAVAASSDDRFGSAIDRAANYLSAEVQPDHASSHPLGIGPLLRTASGCFLADMMLHAAGVQSPATMDAVSLMLLAEAIRS